MYLTCTFWDCKLSSVNLSVLSQNKLRNCASSWFTKEIYHDARSHEHQIEIRTLAEIAPLGIEICSQVKLGDPNVFFCADYRYEVRFVLSPKIFEEQAHLELKALAVSRFKDAARQTIRNKNLIHLSVAYKCYRSDKKCETAVSPTDKGPTITPTAWQNP